MLILPPHRGMDLQPGIDVEQFVTQKQWCNRFERWVEFFHHQCPNVRHLAICINKADLFCDVEAEGKTPKRKSAIASGSGGERGSGCECGCICDCSSICSSICM